jgi:hypothetical protein
LLKCGECGANYIITNATSYSCASFTTGGPAACDNNARCRRDAVEQGLFAGTKQDALSRRSSRRFDVNADAIELWSTQGVEAAVARVAGGDQQILMVAGGGFVRSHSIDLRSAA